jgi:hypothetical protein
LFTGWTLGGLMLAFIGKDFTLVVSFLLVTLSIISLFMIKVKAEPHVASVRGLFSRLTIGWGYVFKHQALRTLVLMDLIEASVGTIWIGAVTLTYAEQALGKDETWWGYINGTYYFGTIIGGFIVYRLAKIVELKLTTFMLLGSGMFGLLTFTYGFMSNPYLALLLVVFMGPSYQIRDLAQETMYQNSTDTNTLTKILAVRSTLVQLIFMISIVGIGVFTDLLGVRLVYILSGCVLMSSALFGFVQLKVRKLRQDLQKENQIDVN